MALTGIDHEFLAATLDAESILNAARLGSISDDDAALALKFQAASGGMSTMDVIPVFAESVASLVRSVVNPIDNVFVASGNALFGITDKIKAAIEAALGPLIDALTLMENRIISGITAPLDSLTGFIDGISDGILDEIAQVVSSTASLLDDLTGSILGPVLGQIDAAINLIGTIDEKVKSIINIAIAPIAAVTGQILDNVQGFATALRDTIPELGNILGGALGGVGDTIGTAVRDAFQAFIDSTGLGGLKEVMSAVARIPELADFQGAFSPDITEKMGTGTFVEYEKRAPQMLALMIPFIGTLANLVFAGGAERVRQASMGDENVGLLPISDLTTLEQRGLANPEDTRAVAFRSGLDDFQLDQVRNITRQRFGTGDIIDHWRRELITPGEANARLRDLGWDQNNVDLIKEAAFPPPGVQDLIRMAVREVFSPEIAEAFGQFEDQPAKYTEWALKIGLSEEWAKNFWAAHWVLPSINQGFDMRHRDVIDDARLDSLFVALDVMPFWREPLKAIAFRPFTRVDVRRMFALGILDRAGVLRAYLDLGFDSVKAENMTEFTVRWVESTRKVEKDRERDLTKGDIIGLLNDGLLDPGAAKTQLEAMGFDENESELLIRREEVQELSRDRKADIRLIVEQAKIKVLTFSEAQDSLDGLDLTRKELDKAMVEVTRATKEKVRLPTKSDLDGWEELQLLTPGQYENELQNLGFPDKYVALYVAERAIEEAEDLLAAEEREAAKTEPRSVSKGQLDSLHRQGVIDSDEYMVGLDALGFAQTPILRFLEQITVTIEERRIADEQRAARGEEAAARERLISRVVLGKLLLKGVIKKPAYREGLTQLGFSIESIDLLDRLIQIKLDDQESPSEE